jgi:hypothetical protein
MLSELTGPDSSYGPPSPGSWPLVLPALINWRSFLYLSAIHSCKELSTRACKELSKPEWSTWALILVVRISITVFCSIKMPSHANQISVFAGGLFKGPVILIASLMSLKKASGGNVGFLARKWISAKW